ncbi:alpha/beta hydrolase [Bordetella genomosp. 1]|uniref:Alpha/beta hydrolase n=1 Tax=Bordetella genomosp. 1 TaxID=1395607 RepID=A0A261RWM6_9BORD|nr:alpha/beta hydrolase [Bordetella genomosp. 1]OZI29301.1 alpha/beta hydrolase [Bordetella genomosp. 1]
MNTPTGLTTALAPGKTDTLGLAGPAGHIELLRDAPAGAPRGLAIVTHPQPLLGGSPRHKIPHRLAHALRDDGWLVYRPAFRGVGASAGTYDHGEGESADLLALIAALRAEAAALPLALVGFSFGAYVAARTARALADAGASPACTALAGLPVGEVPAERSYDTPTLPADVLLIHGEADAQAPLAPLMDWARPTRHPVVVVPGTDHFFSGALETLIGLVRAHAARALPPA